MERIDGNQLLENKSPKREAFKGKNASVDRTSDLFLGHNNVQLLTATTSRRCHGAAVAPETTWWGTISKFVHFNTSVQVAFKEATMLRVS